MKKILIVDDDEQMRILLAKKLTERVFIVETACGPLNTKDNKNKCNFIDLYASKKSLYWLHGVCF